MKNVIRNKNFYAMLFLDAVLVTMAYILSYWLRFDGSISIERWANIKNTLPLFITLKAGLLLSVWSLQRNVEIYKPDRSEKGRKRLLSFFDTNCSNHFFSVPLSRVFPFCFCYRLGIYPAFHWGNSCANPNFPYRSNSINLYENIKNE